MGWNDGVTKELSEFLESVGTVGAKSIEAIKTQIDIEAEAVHKQLLSMGSTPRGVTLGLINSLVKVEVTNRKNWYGYRIEYEGKNAKGVPYQRIANILNFGSSTIQGKRFISKAIRKLRGMDDRIAERFENLSREVTSGN